MNLFDKNNLNNNIQPLVTVGVASYNNAPFIVETLDSIANQTYKNIEVIIHDDASTDNSVEIINNWIKKHHDLNVIFIKSQINLGICKSGNKIISLAKGEYLALVGSDDRYLPDFVKKRVKFLENSDNQVGFCYSSTYVINTFGIRIKNDERPTPSGYLFEYLASVRHSLCKPFTCLYKTECFKKVGNYDESLLYEDLDWFYRASRIVRIEFYPDNDTEFRIVTGSLGSRLSSEFGMKSQFEIIKKNLGFSKIADKSFRYKLKHLAFNAYKSNYQVLSRNIYKFHINYYKDYYVLLFWLLTFLSPQILRKIKNKLL